MSTYLSQALAASMAVAIAVVLWRARQEHIARIGDGWRYLLLGIASLLLGSAIDVFFLLFLHNGHLPVGEARPRSSAAQLADLFGYLLLTIGLARWLLAARRLSAETAAVERRYVDLRRRSSRDELLLSTVPAALYSATTPLPGEKAKIIFLNDKIEEMLGYKRHEFQADPSMFFELMHPEDKQRFDQVERTGVWNAERSVLEHRYLHRDRDYRWIRRHIMLTHDQAGEVTGCIGCCFDISDLKAAESKLLNFLEAAPDAVITINHQREIVLVNIQAERLFGYSRAELLGRRFSTLIPEKFADGNSIQRSLCFTDSDRFPPAAGMECSLQRADGTTFPAEISLSPLESGDEKLVALAVRDVSKRKKIEAQLQQAQKMEAVGQLTGGIAHDFNNLLIVVIGNLQLLQLASTVEDVKKTTQAALDAALRGAELTRRLLAFSRQQLLAPKVADVNDLVKGIQPLLRRTLGEDVNLKVQLATELWLTRVDLSQIENSLVNLAINARDAMRFGGTLTIETSNATLDDGYAAQQEVSPGDYVLITVSDNGTGISEDVLPHVFDPFFSTKDVSKGSGLGLSMVYGFVKQSKGHVKAYSEEGHGTAIKLYLPRSQSESDEPAEPTISKKSIPSGDETILLVEDDPAVREVAIALLTALGYHVHHAATGAEALTLLNDVKHIDLLFTDMVMPGGMTGAELAGHARQRNPDLKVLYTSGYTETVILDNGLLHQGDDILNKPYRKEELAQSVRDVLDRQ